MATVDGAEPAGPRRTHRLLSEADIRARVRPAVADYLLAVRGELVVRFGEVDTYRRFAAELGSRVRHPTQTDLRKLARGRADHFNNAAGPP